MKIYFCFSAFRSGIVTEHDESGCSYEEILEDYMISYQNYYGITKDSDPEKYRLIADINIIPMYLRHLFDFDDW